jgi:hypothetical protein
LNFFCAGAPQEIGKSTSLLFAAEGDLSPVSAKALARPASPTTPAERIAAAMRDHFMPLSLSEVLDRQKFSRSSTAAHQLFY